jgi:hypothetical protein
MLMVKEALFYSAISMVAFFCMQLFAGKLTDVQAECRESQFCGGYVPPIPPGYDVPDSWKE